MAKRINGRNKGKAYELQIIHKLRDLGFENAVSSRSESRNLDNAGVDICNVPFHIQCKAVEKGVGPHDLLNGMPSDKMRFVFWKRNRRGTVVSMLEEDFYALLERMHRLAVDKDYWWQG